MIASSGSASEAILTSVTRLATEPGRWGGCAARLASNPKTVSGLEACGNWYVTFDCEALTVRTTKAEAQTKFQQAQLAFVAEKRLYVEVDPTAIVNGVCLATRTDVLP